MKTTKPLIILGQASVSFLKEWDSAFSTGSDIKKAHVFFCDYSNCDIPVGHVFDTIQIDNIIVADCQIILKRVSQQFLKPFDYIPEGWQTICEFEFIGKVPEIIAASFPIIESWDSPNHVIIKFS
ncbi:hypothetical protein [Ferruginibacter sp. SUN106]|uniref:hypothetical protein n=1 Tax=Ferruginibacter sp. SUN106 TaxID=2978348 RepID=UPI003D35DF5A